MSRRPGVGAQRRIGLRGFGGGRPSLSVSSGGTFTRSTEGSYLTGAATDGSSAFLAWAGVNERRIENRGDSVGQSLLLEGSRVNTLLHSETFSNAAWTKGGSATVSADTNAAPDGVSDADTLVFTASASDYVSQIATTVPANAARGVFTVYLRAAAPQTVRLRMLQKDGATYGSDVSCAVTTTWQRFELNQAVGTGVVAPTLEIWNHTDAAARDVFAWGAQFECSAATVQSPSSYERTTTAAVTRGADVLSYAVGQYPAGILSGGGRFIYAPDCTDAEMVSSAVQHTFLSSNGSQNFFHLQITGGTIKPRIAAQNTAKVTAAAITFSRGQAITIDFCPLAGTITVSGATTGNGTTTGVSSSLTAGTIHVGSLAGSAEWLFGRLAPTIEIL